MRVGWAAVAWGVAFSMAGCQHKPASGESIPEVCRIENNGQFKSVSGYITTPLLGFCGKRRCVLALRDKRAGETASLSLSVAVGTGKNQLSDLPEKYSEADIHLKDDAGTDVRGGSAVRLTGKMSVVMSDGSKLCTLDVDKVEAR
ncbi:MAG TPA: hypothetical protein PK156_29970 [Polyangium sp.]|nr:hypothetical protein [Polyangium sp.]